MPGCRRGLDHLCLQLMIGAFLLDAGLAEAAEINCAGTVPLVSDCLIATQFGLKPPMVDKLTDSDEAAGKLAQVKLLPRAFDFFDARGLSDVFRISGVAITLESDPSRSAFTKPRPADFTIVGETTKKPVFMLRVISDLDRSKKSECPTGNECVLAIIAGIRDPIPLALISESAHEEMTDVPFPGLVIDFTEPGSDGAVIGDRLTILPFTFSFRSDAERSLPFEPGQFIHRESADIFQVSILSDTRPEVPEIPEPDSFFLFATGALACIGLRSRVFYMQNRSKSAK
jgi:hypothetical protein